MLPEKATRRITMAPAEEAGCADAGPAQSAARSKARAQAAARIIEP
jgi:hypothetical protein